MWKPLTLSLGLLFASPHEVIAAPAGGLVQDPPAAVAHHRLAMRHVGARALPVARPTVQVVEASASRGKATARPLVLRALHVRR